MKPVADLHRMVVAQSRSPVPMMRRSVLTLLRKLCVPPLTTTRSGLMYRDVHVPQGSSDATARRGSPVAIHYTGRLEDGTIFDSSVDRSPLTFTLGSREVIKGMDEGCEEMLVGGRRQLVIPPHLGYGPRGAPPAIPPNALLHFDIELVHVNQPSTFSRLTTLLKALPFFK